jgi:hypothetical protein
LDEANPQGADGSGGEAEGEDLSTSAAGGELLVGEIAWLLLYRLNFELAATLGFDFELGHTYFWQVGVPSEEQERLVALARVWDDAVFPQLRERYLSRPEELLRILRLGEDDAEPPAGYLLKRRAPPPGSSTTRDYARDVLQPLRFQEAVEGQAEHVKATFVHLAGL